MVFGAKPTIDTPMTLTAAVGDLANLKSSGKEILLDGKVDKMCFHKGDWLSWEEGDHQVLVQFKDHAFTVPSSIHGKKIRAQGYVLDKALPKDCDNPEHQGKELPGHLSEPKGTQVFFVASGLEVF